MKLPLKLIGWFAGFLSALASFLWRKQKLATMGATIGFILGSSAGVAFGGTAYNAALLSSVFGALVGYFLSSNIRKRN